MRPALLLAFMGAVCALAPLSTIAQNPPRYHVDTGASGRYSDTGPSGRYSPPVTDDCPRYYSPLWTFYYYPRGVPQNLYDPKTPGYRYYPYFMYRSDYPRDHYDRTKSQRYPVR